mgnify:CR=1 FL=1
MADTSTPDLPRTSAAVAEPTSHDPDARGHFGVFGGRYVPEALMAVIEEVTAAYEKARTDQTFLDELDRLQTHYAGRPSPLYEASRLSEHAGGARIFLKREDLNHTGSHKINNVLGQVLLGDLPRPIEKVLQHRLCSVHGWPPAAARIPEPTCAFGSVPASPSAGQGPGLALPHCPLAHPARRWHGPPAWRPTVRSCHPAWPAWPRKPA